MALNWIWCGLFLASFLVGLYQCLWGGDSEVFSKMVQATFDMGKTGFEISLGLTGVMTLWLGLMKVGETAGVIRLVALGIGPFFHKLFPSIPRNHPVFGSMIMNFSANFLGLDNAATPLGLKAMRELQELNPAPDTASDAQIMFLVLNASGLTFIPLSIMVYRSQLGAANPADVFVPILLATFCSTVAGFLFVAIKQKLSLLNGWILGVLGGGATLVTLLVIFLGRLSSETISQWSSLIGNGLLLLIISSFIAMAVWKRINAFEVFIEGAKEGFGVAVQIIPYLVAMLVAIGIFRASGGLDLLYQILSGVLSFMGFDTQFVPALPTALMKPLSGSGARGMMVEAMTHYGADSFSGRLACMFQGSTETTFYVLAVYFGSVSVRKTRYAVAGGLIADLAGALAAIFLAYLFFS